MTSTRASDADIIQPRQNDALSKVELIIHHQFPGIEFVSPVYAGDIITCYFSPDQNVEVGSTRQAGFNIGYDQGKSTGALMYKLQRKNIDKSNKETISNEEEAICIQLVAIWKVYESGKTCVDSVLIEHDKDSILDRDRLSKLAEYYDLFDVQDLIENTWLMRDNTVLVTSVIVTREEAYYKLKITISEGTINKYTWRPLYIDLDV
jgi:hypothetical protein